MIYLASPYTHKDRHRVHIRVAQTAEAQQRLLEKGINSYSPIMHWEGVAAVAEWDNKGFEFYHKHNTEMIQLCEDFTILQLDGWRDSRGIIEECYVAKKLGRIITGITLEDLRNSEVFAPQLVNTDWIF
jgi:nucleoside 2-deoxyribosyltransferase